jgi:hypothetical protein
MQAVRGGRAWRPWRHRAGATYETNTEASIMAFSLSAALQTGRRIDHTY